MSEYDDSHMLSKILERMAAQSLHLKDKIDSGLEIPSWAEYKLYNAYSGLGSALGTAYPGTYGEEKMAAFSGALDRHPALKGKQSELPDKIQAGIIKKKLRMRKQAASTESQLLQALSAEGGAAGMKALRKRVKEDDLEQALKELIASGKVRRHPDGDLIKESAAATLGEGMFMLARRPGLAQRYNNLRSSRLQRLLQWEIPGTKGIHLPGMNKERVANLSAQLSHPETAVQIALPGSPVHMPIAEAVKKALPGLKKAAAATATKTDPAKWEAAKREAKSKMGGKHSARAMQLATQIYKKKGGGYSGAKPTSQNNSLKKWTKQKWGYSGKDKPGQGGSGVYLPEKKRQRLKSTAEGRKRLASASRKKSEATRKGQQYSSHGLAAGTSLKKSASANDDLRAALGAGAGATLGLVGGHRLGSALIRRNLPGELAVGLGLPLAGGALGAYLASRSGGEGEGAQRARARNAAAGAALGIPYILPAGMAVIASQGRIPESAMLAPIAIGSALGGATKGESYRSAKEAAASKDPRLARAGVSGYNQVKKTPGHPTKSHIVVAKEGDKVKTIRFGQQGVRTNQTAGQREAFKSRHRKNISRGRMSAAYWADKAKWSPKKTKDKDNKKWVKGS